MNTDSRTLRRRLLAGLSVMPFGAHRAQAQTASTERYPTRAVRLVVPAAAGGPSDLVARMVAAQLAEALKQPVLVDNAPGAGMTLGASMVVKAPPDGHTLLFTTSTPIVMSPFTVKKLPYDVKRDLVTVAHVGSTPLVLYVNSTVPVRTIKEFAEWARGRGGDASYGSYGIGSSAHVLMEYMARQLNIKLVHVPYKGVAPEIQDLAGGQIAAAVADVGVPAPFVKNGRIRPVAVTGARRASSLPDVPTFAEQGITGMEPFSPWWGLFAPAGTPASVVTRLGNETVKIARSPEFVAKLRELGGDASGEAADQAGVMVRDEWARWERIIGSMSDISFE